LTTSFINLEPDRSDGVDKKAKKKAKKVAQQKVQEDVKKGLCCVHDDRRY